MKKHKQVVNKKQKTSKVIAISMAILMFLGTFSSIMFIGAGLFEKKYALTDIVSISSVPENIEAYFEQDRQPLSEDDINVLLNLKLKNYSSEIKTLEAGNGLVVHDKQSDETFTIIFFDDNICQINGKYYEIV